MTLKYTNPERTAASFGSTSFCLAAPDDWDSIGDGPTREAVKAWLAAGNTPEPADMPHPNIAIVAQIDTLERAAMLNRGSRELELFLMEDRAAQVAAATGATAASLLDANSYYKKLKALDMQIAQLRWQLS